MSHKQHVYLRNRLQMEQGLNHPNWRVAFLKVHLLYVPQLKTEKIL